MSIFSTARDRVGILRETTSRISMCHTKDRFKIAIDPAPGRICFTFTMRTAGGWPDRNRAGVGKANESRTNAFSRIRLHRSVTTATFPFLPRRRGRPVPRSLFFPLAEINTARGVALHGVAPPLDRQNRPVISRNALLPARGGDTSQPCTREQSPRARPSPSYDGRSTRDVSRGTPGLAPRRQRRTAILTSKSAAGSRAGITPRHDSPSTTRRAACTHVPRNTRGRMLPGGRVATRGTEPKPSRTSRACLARVRRHRSPL